MIKTTCKVKRCLACQSKLTALFKMLVEYQLVTSTQESFYFITLTYRAGPSLQRDARYVAATWTRLLWWFKSRFGTGLKWVRVIELTKARQPHLHVILSFGPGSSSLVPRCERKARYDLKWRNKVCECLEHRISAAWKRITGDSYVVDVRDVDISHAGYLAKYVAKSYIHTEAFRALGFHRSWSRSRTWKVDRLQLETTARNGWYRVLFSYGQESGFGLDGPDIRWEVKHGETSPLRRRVGTEMARELQFRNEDRAAKREILKQMEVLRAGAKVDNNSRNRGIERG